MSNKGNSLIVFVIIIGIVWGLISIFNTDENNSNYNSKKSYQVSDSYEQETEYFGDYECTDDCSGHEAGYEWAEENYIEDADDCGGNSNSFTEGCITFVEENY
jgi:hypothetical protein